MAALRVYIDESGVGDDPTPAGYVFAAAGFMATAEDWEGFSERWIGILRTEGVPDPPELHMKDFLHGRRAFRGWDEDRRARVLGTLIGAINDTPLLGHGCVIARGAGPKDWNATYSGKFLSSARHYYSYGVMRCIWDFLNRADSFLAVEEKIGFVCGSNKNWQGSIAELYEIMKESNDSALFKRLGPIAFDSPLDFPPLQAADLLAYETRRRYVDWKDPERDRFRASLIRLESARRITFCVHEKDSMEPILEEVLTDPSYEQKVKERLREQTILRRKRRREGLA